jgi:CRISPR/Cas system-associated exonuclease Cas4 (RecB family)
MKINLAVCALALLIAFHAAPVRAELTPEQFVDLAQAYQDGYLQLAVAAAVQVYSGAGLIASEFSAGRIDGPAAMEALSDNALLHGVSYATLLEIQRKTPKEDKVATQQIGRLAEVLVLEQDLLTALSDVLSYPTDNNAKRVETARNRVDEALEELAEEQ